MSFKYCGQAIGRRCTKRFTNQNAIRRYSDTSRSISDIATEFLQRTISSGPIRREQVFDSNQLQKLSLSLGRNSLYNGVKIDARPPSDGTPVPPGYHLVYFTPEGSEQDLGIDGTDRTFNPPHPFTRRMWAGGSMQWTKDNLLRVGQKITETTEIVSALPKKTATGEEMIVVGVKKSFENIAGLALVDQRNWIFRREISNPAPPLPAPASVPLPEGTISRDFRQSPVSLFRFSALTFNAHKIHYSEEWCRNVEGHRDLVVHGPLNLINLIDLWRDNQKDGDHAVPQKVDYRATSPLYVGEHYRAILEQNDNGKEIDGKIYAPSGKVAVRSTILSF